MAERKWTRQRVVDGIRDCHKRGIPASHSWRVDRNLCAASFSCFGSWRIALEAAGLPSERQIWSSDRVIAELKALHLRGMSDDCCFPNNSRLTSAAIRYFGSRYKALVAAGLRSDKPRVQRTWTSDQVIEFIQSRRDRGMPLTTVWKDEVSLYSIAKRIFGSWRKALQAAGIATDTRLIPTHQEVIQAIQSRHNQGQPVTGVWRTDPVLYKAARKHFGNWHQALAAAGLPARTRQSWTKRKVVDAILRRHQHGPPLSRAWRDDKPLFRAATNHFGNWQSALRAAGLSFKELRRWSKERVLDELRRTYRGQTSFGNSEPTLVSAAQRFFGGLYHALEAAGLEPPVGRWTKQRIVEAIQEGYVHGRPLQFAGFKDKTLGAAAKRHFGTWRAAVAAAGLLSRLPKLMVNRSWTRKSVVAAIQTRHQRDGLVAVLWKEDTGLYSAAKKHFGTWREAVLAAGLQPLTRQWTPQVVIQEILSRHEQGMALSSVVFKEDCRLGGAAVRIFGSWRAALGAAGLSASPPPSRESRSQNQEKRTPTCRVKP